MSYDKLKDLKVTRADDRAAMAGALMAVCPKGWTATLDEMMTKGRVVWIDFVGPRGLCITIDLDGDNVQDKRGEFVLSWAFNGDDPNAKLNPARWLAGSVNPHHMRKATDLANGFPDLLRLLRLRMDQAVDGSAFL